MAGEFHTTTTCWESSRTLFETATSSSSSLTSSALNTVDWPPSRSSSDNPAGVSKSTTILTNPHLYMMSLDLPSPIIDWNQHLPEKSETGFVSNINYEQESAMGWSQLPWRENVISNRCGERGFSLDEPQFSPESRSGESNVTCQGLATNFRMDYGSPSSSSILQGLLVSDHHHHHPQQQSMDYPYTSVVNYVESMPSWSCPAMNGIVSTFSPSLQTPTFDDKPKITQVAKKNGNEPASKRPRRESPSLFPPFKVRKEKMGVRISALQQLVSPFGKTDTATVLSEAIDYIKFLHEQVNVLITSYVKNGVPVQNHRNSDKSNKDLEGPKQDLRTRGLRLVPISSTFPVTHETTVDFWTPAFGGNFR